jgi:hypothetical protein
MELDANIVSGPDDRDETPEEAIAIRDGAGNVFLIAVKNLPLHRVAAEKKEGIETILSDASNEGFEMVGKVTLPRATRRAAYEIPTVNVVVNIPSPTS